MTLIGFLVLLIIVGVVLAFVPIDAKIRQLIFVVLAILFVLWLLAAFGLLGDLGWHRGGGVRVVR